MRQLYLLLLLTVNASSFADSSTDVDVAEIQALYATWREAVITADIPLAADVVAKGGQALAPRGELYTDLNIGERLAVRNMLDEMRGGGQITGGPSTFTAKDKQAFANQLDRWLTKAGN